MCGRREILVRRDRRAGAEAPALCVLDAEVHVLPAVRASLAELEVA